jgi:hypothetical protein
VIVIDVEEDMSPFLAIDMEAVCFQGTLMTISQRHSVINAIVHNMDLHLYEYLRFIHLLLFRTVRKSGVCGL